jgi:hypothetical protein
MTFGSTKYLLSVAVALLLSTAMGKLSNATYFYNKTRPLVLAHRGASG